MTAPALAAGRLAAACLIGMALGLWYGFLRPLRRKWGALGDLLFLAAAAAGWVYLSFGICRGDLRLGYTAGLAVGGFFWELTAGKALRPVFGRIWQGVYGIFGLFLRPFQKFFQKICNFIKNIFASAKKSATIVWGMSKPRRTHTKGGRHGKITLGAKARPDQIPPQQHADQDSGDLHYRCVYGSASGDRLAN